MLNILLVLSFLLGGVLSVLALVHQVMNKPISLFKDLRIMMIVLFILLPLVSFTVFGSKEWLVTRGGVVLFVMVNLGLWITILPFLVVSALNCWQIFNYAVDHFGEGPSEDKEVEEAISNGDYPKAIRQLRYLESRFPKNFYINESLLKVHELRHDSKACMDKLYTLCRFYPDHESCQTWIGRAKELDFIAGQNLKEFWEEKFKKALEN